MIPFTTATEVISGSALPYPWQLGRGVIPWGFIPEDSALKCRRAGSGTVRTISWDELGKINERDLRAAEKEFKKAEREEKKQRRREARELRRGAFRENSDGGFDLAPTVGQVLLGSPPTETEKIEIERLPPEKNDGYWPRVGDFEVIQERHSAPIKTMQPWMQQAIADYLNAGGIVTVCPLGAYTTPYGKEAARQGSTPTWRYMKTKDTRDFVSLRPRDQRKIRVMEKDHGTITIRSHDDLMCLRQTSLRSWPGFPAYRAPTAFTVRLTEDPAAKVLRRYLCEILPICDPVIEARKIRHSLNYWRK